MAKKRLSVRLCPVHAMTVTRVSLGDSKLAYAILANKPLKYRFGKSRIAYIGTTKKGIARFAVSAAGKAENVLNLHGVWEMEVRIVTCGVRQNVQTWAKLERALLLVFREMYGEMPRCNAQVPRESDEFRYFKRERIKGILKTLAA